MIKETLPLVPPSEKAIHNRHWGLKALNFLLPTTFTEHIESSPGLQRAEELAKENYSIQVIYNHFSERDPFEIYKNLYNEIPLLEMMPTYAPLAWHVYNRNLVQKLLEVFEIQVRPLVTDDTVVRGKDVYQGTNDKVSREDRVLSLTKYREEATERLKAGGWLYPLAPQEGRREKLEYANKKPIDRVLRGTDPESKVALMFVGMGFENDGWDYNTKLTKGFNPFKRFRFTVGPTLTKEELKYLADQAKQSVDEYAFTLLSQLVPEKYNHPEKYPGLIQKLKSHFSK